MYTAHLAPAVSVRESNELRGSTSESEACMASEQEAMVLRAVQKLKRPKASRGRAVTLRVAKGQRLIWKHLGKCRECRGERADGNAAGQQADDAMMMPSICSGRNNK